MIGRSVAKSSRRRQLKTPVFRHENRKPAIDVKSAKIGVSGLGGSFCGWRLHDGPLCYPRR
jgi:hypothetical protein